MTRIWIAGVVLTGIMTTTAMAQDAKTGRFKNTLSAGVTMTDGNSETLQANAALVTEGEQKGLGSVRAGIEGNYGESTVNDEKDTTVENARLFANAKKTITPMTFAYLDGSVLYDSIADIDYRATLGPGLGSYLIKNDKQTLSVEAGLSYVLEKVGGISDDYLAFRFAERYEQTLSKTAKGWQAAEYLPTAADFGDYLMSAELGVEAAINSSMNLRVVLQDKYDSTPGVGLQSNDLTLIAGISYAW